MGKNKLDVFQVIADPSRRQMLHLLSRQTLSINDLAGKFPMSRPAVSKHVRILEETGFIRIRDIGRQRYCQLKPDGFRALEEWLSYYDQFWAERMGKLGQIMDKKRKNP